MKERASIFLVTILINISMARDFYLGMFKKNDFLVAQDTLFKEKTPYRFTYAKYGRLFKCPITYCRVVDRLGVGGGPRVQITTGGLHKKYITLRIVSPYNQPISVNIYVGCANNVVRNTKHTTVKTNKTEDEKANTLKHTTASDIPADTTIEETTIANDKLTTAADGNATATTIDSNVQREGEPERREEDPIPIMTE